MQIEKQRALRKKYPSIFRKPIIIDCWKGWFKIIDRLAEELFKIDKSVKILSITSDLGLKVTLDKTSNDLDKIVESFRAESLKTCEICGEPGKLCSIKLLEQKRVCCDNHK